MVDSVATITHSIISELYGNGNPDKAILSGLREAETIDSKRAESVWPVLFEKLDDRYLSGSPDGRPTWAETAIYTALRCYAIYQQGSESIVYESSIGPESTGKPLFTALASLRTHEDMEIALDRRLQNLFSSRAFLSTIKAVTQLVRILKSSGLNLKIDFAQLAQDLYKFQKSFEAANQIRLKWGRQYYHLSKENINKEVSDNE